ncbi:cyclic nucleotide-binding domain-containing protein [Oxalobacteraceae bacterium]|nr:cyclic nucleotide-binding domain-containing protein [Oxalobacteraceae bacterium]
MKIADLLDELELFREFSFPEIEVIARYLTFEEVDASKTIFHEGDPGNFMLILIEGRISIFKGGEYGRQLLCHEQRGRIVGEMALLDQELRSASCVADTQCEILVLTSDGLKKMASDSPAVAYHFMHSLARLLSRRLRRASGLMADFLSGMGAPE